MQNYLIFCVFFLFIQAGNSQSPCNQAYVESLEQARNPAYVQELADYYAEIPRLAASEQPERAVIRIPVVVHVIHTGTAIGTAQNISDARISAQIDVLNSDFRRLNTDANQTPALFLPNAADTEIEFSLAEVDENGNPTTGITRHNYSSIPNVDFIEQTVKPQTNWNPNRYMNLWSVPTPEKENFILGYSYLPTQSILGDDKDGVVIVYDRFGLVGNSKGRTATHEVGHYLGLPHIFGAGANGGCDTDDGILDTPNSGSPYFGCPSFPQNSCASSDMYMNYMDYVNDNCMNMFTRDQGNVMQSVLTTARSGLANNLDVAVTEAALEASIQMYPNPASQSIHFDLPRASFLKNISLYSAKGKRLKALNYNPNEALIFDVSDLEVGIYFVALTVGKEIIWKKLAVVR